MSLPILATKLYIPPPQPKVVQRLRLFARLNEGLHRKLTLISAPAGFGKSTLVSEWINDLRSTNDNLRPNDEKKQQIQDRQSEIVNHIAWLSLDEGDNHPTRFLTYFIAALQTVVPDMGKQALGILQSPQTPSAEAILTALLNEIGTLPGNFIVVLDDYHIVDAKPIDHGLTFLLEHLPPQMHLIITTREDPNLPLARLRVRGQLTELRATDLRFTPAEVAGFLNQAMGLSLSIEEIAALESRTEGWIAGLQLAAISMQGNKNTGPDKVATFIKSFTGSHRFVLDYLVEEVLQQQPESVQSFLLHTSILDRLCGPLCDAVLQTPSGSGQKMLETIEQANLFIVPLDDERRWYRYHRLFADLLRQRLQQSAAPSIGNEGKGVSKLHIDASTWYEDNGLEIEAFHHATAANDVTRAERLIEGKGMPMHFRGAVAPVLNWLESQPAIVLDSYPSLWTSYASVLLVTGQTNRVEQTLQSAEKALQGVEPADDEAHAKHKDLIGRVAAIRATLAASLNQVEAIITQSQRALDYLHPNNLPFRTSTTWKLGFAYQLKGDRLAASQAYSEVISISQATGNTIFAIVATVGLGIVQESENQLYLAAESYQSVLRLFDKQPLPIAGEAYLGLARIHYQWNDLEAALRYGQQGVELTRQIESNDRFIIGELLLARLKVAQGDIADAAAIVAKASQSARQHNFVNRMADVVAMQIVISLHQGNLAEAMHLAQSHEQPMSQARVYLAQSEATAALAVLEPLYQQAVTKHWVDEQLKARILQAIIHHADGHKEKAIQLLVNALMLARPGGFIRLFVDEGLPMAQLLTQLLPKATAHGVPTDYICQLLDIFEAKGLKGNEEVALVKPSSTSPTQPAAQPLIEPLSQRELEVLQLIAQGLSNHQICEQLFLALSTVKGHNRNIFGKLQVQRRTEAVVRARELGLL